MVQTRKVAVQSETHKTAGAAVQTDFPDIMEDLKKQVARLTNIVAELTEFKAKQTLRPTPSTPPLYFSDSDTFCDSLISRIIDQEPVAAIDQSLVPDQSTNHAVPASDKFPPAMNQHLLVPAPPVTDSAVPASGQNHFVSTPLSSRSPHPQLQSPLSATDTNAQVVFNSIDRGPTDDQKRKVKAIVLMSAQMVSSAMAAVNALFSEEVANGNKSGTNGYKKLDGLKLHFLQSVLQQKQESETFTEDLEDIKAKINTRCRGKRRTFQRLQKQIDFSY